MEKDTTIVFVGSLKNFPPNTIGITAYCGKCNCEVHLSDTTIAALKKVPDHKVILVCEDHWEEEIKENDPIFVPLTKEQLVEINNFIK